MCEDLSDIIDSLLEHLPKMNTDEHDAVASGRYQTQQKQIAMAIYKFIEILNSHTLANQELIEDHAAKKKKGKRTSRF